MLKERLRWTDCVGFVLILCGVAVSLAGRAPALPLPHDAHLLPPALPPGGGGEPAGGHRRVLELLPTLPKLGGGLGGPAAAGAAAGAGAKYVRLGMQEGEGEEGGLEHTNGDLPALQPQQHHHHHHQQREGGDATPPPPDEQTRTQLAPARSAAVVLHSTGAELHEWVGGELQHRPRDPGVEH